MIIAKKITKLARGQYKCFVCKSACMAKAGDWHDFSESSGDQVFVCRKCEQQFKQVVPVNK